jgi:glycosyltransferase involved in cell wall biosynthesis
VTVDGGAVSVIVPVRDGERYLGEALDSIIGQSQPPHEIVVVDDGSTDATVAIAQGRGPTVRVLRQEPVGQFAAMNAGIEASDGPLLAFLDADDLWTPDSLASRLARLAEDDDLEAVFGRTVQFVSPELDADAMRFKFDPGPVSGTLFQTMLVRRSGFTRVGPLAVDYATSANIDWMSRAGAAGLRSARIPDVVARRRLHGANISITAKDTKDADLVRVVRNHVRRTHPRP